MLYLRLFTVLALVVSYQTLLGASPFYFRDISDLAGIKFVHTDGSSGKRLILETVSAGLGLIDFDSDGYPDILFLNGMPLTDTQKLTRLPTAALYRNNRNGTFTDVTSGSGLDQPGYAMGCAVADYNNDGFEDIFITYYGEQRLYRNNGNRSFTDVTQKTRLNTPSLTNHVGAGCLFLDYDRDGFLDLFVSDYLVFDPKEHQPKLYANIPIYPSPRIYPRLPSRLYHNNGDGTFSDVSKPSGIGQHLGYGMGIVSGDFDGDGWPDIYVGNDVQENFLFRNQHDGTFAEVGIQSGTAFDEYGDSQGTMGANAGDFDGDGLFDILVTDYQNQVNTLYRNLGKMQFQDVTSITGVGVGSRPLVTWGCGIVDFDNDGIPEIFTAAGHLQDTIDQYDKSTSYKQRSLLLQQRAGRFVDVAPESGALATLIESSRGSVFGDLNNDGRVDIVILNSRSKPTLLSNETVTSNHWATLKLIGTRSNRSAVGALARVTVGVKTQVDEVRAGRGYQSAEDLRLHFGLGTNTIIDRIQVAWPSGMTNIWTRLPVDRVLYLTEGNESFK